jgi:cytochrome c biogenesis protein CcmG/thiol:disulfide interchange protein DsbE
VAVNTRVLAGSLIAALVISVAGGYALSRAGDSDPDEADVTPGTITLSTGIPTNKPVQGKKLPTVDLTDTDGNSVSTADLLGQPLVINVWAVTCEACKTEMPALARVQSDLGETVRFIGVNTAKNDGSALAFAADKGVRYELLSDINGELTGSLGITGLPYTLFVAADGTIAAQKGIALNEAAIRSTIASTLTS